LGAVIWKCPSVPAGWAFTTVPLAVSEIGGMAGPPSVQLNVIVYGMENGPFSIKLPVKCSWIVLVPQSGVATAASRTCASEVLAPSRNAQAAKSTPPRTGCEDRRRGRRYVRCMGILLVVWLGPRSLGGLITISQVSKTSEKRLRSTASAALQLESDRRLYLYIAVALAACGPLAPHPPAPRAPARRLRRAEDRGCGT